MMVPSLQKLCGTKFAVVISTQPEIKEEIFFDSLKSSSSSNRWNLISQCRVEEIVKKNKNIPFRLMEIIPIYLIPLIGLQMRKWATFLQSKFGLTLIFSRDFLKCSHFTSIGKIDEEKAARELVKEPGLSTILQYRIACYYYLSDIIPSLWKILRDTEPKFKSVLKKYDSEQPFVLWSEYLEKKEKNFSAIFKPGFNYEKDYFIPTAFSSGSSTGNVAAVKFCKKAMEVSKMPRKKGVKFGKKSRISWYNVKWPSEFTGRTRLRVKDLILSRNLEGYINILEFFLRQMNKTEIKNFLLHFQMIFNVLNFLLYWPYQYLFQNSLDAVYEYIDKRSYYDLMQNIVDLIGDPELGKTCNYRLLLKEFWINCPSYLKDYVLGVEGGYYAYNYVYNFTPLLSKLFNLEKIEYDDECNILLILEHRTPLDIDDTSFVDYGNAILEFQGKKIILELSYKENFRLADLFLKGLKLPEKEYKTFKRNFAFDQLAHVIEYPRSLTWTNELIKWAVVSAEEIYNFKQELFSQLLDLKRIVCRLMFSGSPFLDEFIIWLLNTGNNEFIGGIFFSHGIEPEWLDELLEKIDYTEEKIFCLKKNIMPIALPYIVVMLHKMQRDSSRNEVCLSKILSLCNNDEENIREFIGMLQVWCKNCIQLNLCVICHHSSDNIYCDLRNSNNYNHPRKHIFLSLEDVKYFCSVLRI